MADQAGARPGTGKDDAPRTGSDSTVTALLRAPRPVARPVRSSPPRATTPRAGPGSAARVTPAAFSPAPAGRDTGAPAAICNDPRLTGQRIAEITSATRGCGIPLPVRVSRVAGVRLSQPIVVNCETATRFADWIEDEARPAAADLGSRLVQIDIAASYACRPRNNQSGARVSEHGRGNAVDLSAFRLADGREITVLDGWTRRREKPFLATLHESACGPFGTVLGPEADRYHQNHFHFDIAEYRNGAYCR